MMICEFFSRVLPWVSGYTSLGWVDADLFCGADGSLFRLEDSCSISRGRMRSSIRYVLTTSTC